MAQRETTNQVQMSGLAAALYALSGFFTGGFTWVGFFVTAATTFVFSNYMAYRAKRGMKEEMAARTQTIRSATSPHRIVYGEAVVGGTLVYAEVTGADKQYLHLVIVLAGHEVYSIDDIWLDDERLGPLNATTGIVTTGTYANRVRVKKYLGTAAQTADADLVTESAGQWTAQCTLGGLAYVVVRIQFNQDVDQGIPNLRARVRGRLCYDPRDAITRYTTNPALQLRDYLTSDFGLGCLATEIDDTLVAAAANVCEGVVALDASLSVSAVFDHTTDTFSLASADPRLSTGDRCVLTGVPVPTGLTSGATYYIIRRNTNTFQLATSFRNAFNGTAVAFSSNGSGTQTLNTFAHYRFVSNGTFTLDQPPGEIEQALRSAMAGFSCYSQGKWRLYAGRFVAPTITLTADDLRDAAAFRPRRPRRELCNAVAGVYVEPAKNWSVTDYPQVSDATYVTEDGGDTLVKQLELPTTINLYQAQRLAKIALRRSRGRALQLKCKITALQVSTAEHVAVTLPQLGLSATRFRVTGWRLTGEDGAVGVDLDLLEEPSTVYDWAGSEAGVLPVVPALELRSLLVGPPTGLAATSGNDDLVIGTDGSIVSRIRLTWTFAAEPNPSRYEVQWKLTTDATWSSSQTIPGDTNAAYIAPVEDGLTYNLRVRTVRASGQRSSWATLNHLVVGKTAAPTAPTTLTVTAALNGFDISWSRSPDADYKESLLYQATTNDWTAASLVGRVTGNRFSRTGLPSSVTRYFWVLHTDTSGNQSTRYPNTTTGVAGTTLEPPAGVPTVANAATITGTLGGDPPSGAQYWAVFDNTTGKIWRWQSSSGTYTKAADGADITANTVAANALSVANLAAISANMGTLTAGSINLTAATGNNIRSGATSVTAGAGFWMGGDGATVKFRFGQPVAAGNKYLFWDGTTLNIGGAIVLTDNIAANAVTLPVGANGTDLNNPGTTFTQLVSIVIDSGGQPVQLSGGMTSDWTAAGGTAATGTELRVLIDGSVINTWKGVIFQQQSHFQYFSIQHTPTSGSHTYSLEARAIATVGTAAWFRNISLYALALKR